MSMRLRTATMLFLLAAASVLSGCAINKGAEATLYDLGPLRPLPQTAPAGAVIAAAPMAPITVADVTSAAWLDSQMMYYRLDYANDQQPHPYASSRWNMPPPQLLGQRVKARLAQGGNAVLSATDGATNVAMLRIEADDFSQRFISANQSEVHIALRASVFNGRMLVAQKSFDQRRAAASADAAGGASALAAATDLLIGDLMAWMATLPAKK